MREFGELEALIETAEKRGLRAEAVYALRETAKWYLQDDSDIRRILEGIEAAGLDFEDVGPEFHRYGLDDDDDFQEEIRKDVIKFLRWYVAHSRLYVVRDACDCDPNPLSFDAMLCYCDSFDLGYFVDPQHAIRAARYLQEVADKRAEEVEGHDLGPYGPSYIGSVYRVDDTDAGDPEDKLVPIDPE